jgi:hypothetical protein
VGTFSTGLIDAALAKRNTASAAVVQYELDQISGSAYSDSAPPYSDCFATEDVTSPPKPAVSFQGACPAGSSYVLRADVAVGDGPSPTSQLWSVSVVTWPSEGKVGKAVQIIKVDR